MLSKNDIDSDLLEEDEPVILAAGGNEGGVGYKYSKYYSLKLYYVPSEDMFVLSKSSINGVRKWSFNSLRNAIKKYNRLCEDSYEEDEVRDVFDVPDYVFRELES